MDGIKDIVESVKENLNERFKNPILGAFIIAWFAFNWKGLVYFLFSGEDISTIISKISSDYSSPCNTLLMPLLFALAYPFIKWLSAEVSHFATKFHRAANTKDRKDYWSKQGDVIAERNKVEDQIAKLRSKEEVNQENTQLKTDLEDVKRVNSELEKKITEQSEAVEKSKFIITAAITMANEYFAIKIPDVTAGEQLILEREYSEFRQSDSDLVKQFDLICNMLDDNFSIEDVRTGVSIDKLKLLEDQGLITASIPIAALEGSEPIRHIYSLTDKGRYFRKTFVKEVLLEYLNSGI